jgi:FAD/FMN-containing dehydrogenase
MTSYVERRELLARQLRDGRGDAVGLAKDTSNLFRDRARTRKQRIDARGFDHVIEVNPKAHWVDVEGMTSYDTLVNVTLATGTMPAVVPELKTITIGGAAAGVGIEATSFRHGLVHETLLEMDVLTGTGEVVTATPTNEHADLFFGFPNSYGTLGYALRLRAELIPVKRFVRVERTRFTDGPAYFDALARACTDPTADFVDGVVFARDELWLNVARFVDEAPQTSDYGFEQIYYRSIREKPVDFLTTHDWLWRWDTDWFWCSKNLGAQVPWIRRLYGRERLGSRTYTRLMRASGRLRLGRIADAARRVHGESVIQDVDVPIESAAAFLDFYLPAIGILPVWICPIGPTPVSDRFPLYPLRPDQLYVNFGFWDVVRTRQRFPAGHHNRLVEAEVMRLGGIKSLYSESFFTPEEFEAAYGVATWRTLKARYDPDGRLGDLYAKCVLQH